VLTGAVLVLAAAAAYHNTLDGPFIFDDDVCIPCNASIQHLGAIETVLSTPGGGGITVSGRPMLNLSLAINYALGDTRVRGYHLANLAIHILAGLVLFGIVRRTLLLPSMRGAMLPSAEACRATVERPGHASADGSMAPGFGPAAPYLAGAVALLWMLHPLQTESVTYIIQRAESLMGLFYLLTLYCVIRSSQSRPVGWSLAAVAACAMGMATKEVMVTAPLIVLLYDRTFLRGSFLGALRKRWGLYCGLSACWGLLAFLVVWGPGRGSTAGFQAEGGLDWPSYGLTQLSVIPHYLRLTFWPDALCLDYGLWVKTAPWEVLPGAILVAALAVATIWGLCRGRKWGFLGAWFLGILAPTSSIVPIRDTLFEHRMYLSLAAVASLAVLGVFLLRRRLLSGPWAAAPWFALVLVASALGYRTVLRNMDYHSTLAIWKDTTDQCPSNARARCNLGFAYENQAEHDLAASEYRRAIRLDPCYAEAYYDLGVTLMAIRDYDSAIEQFRLAIRHNPKFAEAYYNLGFALSTQGKYEEGIEQLESAIRDKPQLLETYNVLGAILLKQGKVEPAVETFRQAIRMNPQYADGHNGLGVALESQGKLDEAIEHFRLAIQANPRFLMGYRNLARVLGKAGQNQEAHEVQRQAAELEMTPPSP